MTRRTGPLKFQHWRLSPPPPLHSDRPCGEQIAVKGARFSARSLERRFGSGNPLLQFFGADNRALEVAAKFSRVFCGWPIAAEHTLPAQSFHAPGEAADLRCSFIFPRWMWYEEAMGVCTFTRRYWFALLYALVTICLFSLVVFSQ